MSREDICMMKEMQEQNAQTENLIRTYGDEILRLLYLYVKDLDIAKDLFQDTFVKVHLRLKDFRNDSNIKTWITRIAINTAKDYLKSAWNQKVSGISEDEEKNQMDIVDTSPQIEDTVIAKERRQTVRQAVMELKEEYKDVVTCVYFLDMSVDDASKHLGIPPGTVKSRLSRARGVLREILERRGI